jgi:hypothetical protein
MVLRLSVIIHVSSFSPCVLPCSAVSTLVSMRIRTLAVEAMERGAEIVKHGREITAERDAAPDQHIITVRSHRYDVEALDQFTKSAADPVALGGGAVLLGNGEANADRAAVLAGAALEDESRARGPRAIGNGEEVRPLP